MSEEGSVKGARGELIHLPNIVDPRGNLTIGEFGRHIPFEAKRYFIVYQVPLVSVRGEHAHKQCHQFLIAVRGKVQVRCESATHVDEFTLNAPSVGVYLPPMVWGSQYGHSPDAVLLVFASNFYDETDYIRDYDQFRELI